MQHPASSSGRPPAGPPRGLVGPLAVVLATLAGCGGGGGGGSTQHDLGVGPPTTTFSGTVTARGAALAGVTVVAYSTNTNAPVATATTDANGRYSFAGLGTACTDDCTINYQFFATKAGYAFAPQGSAGGVWYAPASDWHAATGADVSRAGYNGAFTNPGGGAGIVFTVWNFDSTPGSSTSVGDFVAYDGSDAPARLAASGQAIPYAAGDDASVHAGVAWPARRFVDNGDGTVADTLTGLVWLRDAGCLAPANWSDALQAVAHLASGACGLADGSAAGQWRMPNAWELESVVDESAAHPAVTPGSPFANVGPGGYWTSTSYYGGQAGSPAAWAIRMDDGRYLNDGIANDKASAQLGVWAVRDGPPGAVALQATGFYVPYAGGDDGSLRRGVPLTFPRMRDNADGTVTDTVTGLVWLRQADCLGGTWSDAVAAVRALANGQCGLSDGSQAGSWHLPNRKEMESLVDRAQGNQADFFDTAWTSAQAPVPSLGSVFDRFAGFEYYWTSTTDAADPTQAWSVFSCDFGVYDTAKTATAMALAVR